MKHLDLKNKWVVVWMIWIAVALTVLVVLQTHGGS